MICIFCPAKKNPNGEINIPTSGSKRSPHSHWPQQCFIPEDDRAERCIKHERGARGWNHVFEFHTEELSWNRRGTCASLSLCRWKFSTLTHVTLPFCLQAKLSWFSNFCLTHFWPTFLVSTVVETALLFLFSWALNGKIAGMNQELLVTNNMARISSFIYKEEAGNGFCPPVPVWPKIQCTPTVLYKPRTWAKCFLTINPAGHWRANFCLLLLSFPFSFSRSILAGKGVYICVCVYIYICKYIYVCVYIYIYCTITCIILKYYLPLFFS